MTTLLAILFAFAIHSPDIGKFWDLPSWCPTETGRGDTPGSDGFSREGHIELTATDAAAFYSILDAYDTRMHVFSHAAMPTNKVYYNERGLIHYSDFLTRKNAIRENYGVFGNVGGEALAQYAESQGYAPFTGFSWTDDPYADAGAGIGWFPTYATMSDEDCYIGSIENEGGLAYDILMSIGANDAVLEHDPTGEIFDFTADDMLENSFIRCNPADITNDSRAISWKPLEITAQAIAAQERLYDVLPRDAVYTTLSNIAVSAQRSYNYGGGECAIVKVVCNDRRYAPYISFEPGHEHDSLPIGSKTFETNYVAYTNFYSPVTSPRASVSALSALIQVNGYGVIGSRMPEWNVLENAILDYMSSNEVSSVRVFGRTPKNSSGYTLYAIRNGQEEEIRYFYEIEDSYIEGTYNPVLECSAVSDAKYSAKSWEMMLGMYAHANEYKLGNTSIEKTGYGNTNRFHCISCCYSVARTNNIGKTGIVDCQYHGDSYSGYMTLTQCVQLTNGSLVSEVSGQISDITYSSAYLTPNQYMMGYNPVELAESATNLQLGIIFDRNSSTGTVTWTGTELEFSSEDPEREGEEFLEQFYRVWVTDMYSEKIREAATAISDTRWVQETEFKFPTLRRYQRDQDPTPGPTPQLGTLELKNPDASESQYENVYVGLGYAGIEADEPVVYAKRRAFYNAFANCTNAKFAHFNMLIEAGESSFEKAFYGCTSMTNASFNGLPYAGDRAFKEAFVNTKVKETDFASLTNCGSYAFENAYAGDTNLTEISFPSLVGFGTGAFKGAFSNATALTGLRFSSIEYVPTNVFNSSFVDCVALTNVDFGSVKVCRDDAFNGAFEDAKNIENVDFHSMTSCGARAFHKAFAGTEEPKAFKFKELSFNNLVTAGGGAFEEAFAYSEPYLTPKITPHDSKAWLVATANLYTNKVAILGRQAFLNEKTWKMYFVKNGVKRGCTTCTMSYGPVYDYGDFKYESDFRAVATMGSETDRFNELVSDGWKICLVADNGYEIVCNSTDTISYSLSNVSYTTESYNQGLMYVTSASYTTAYHGPSGSNHFIGNAISMSLFGYGGAYRSVYRGSESKINQEFQFLDGSDYLRNAIGTFTCTFRFRTQGFDDATWLWFKSYRTYMKLVMNVNTPFGTVVVPQTTILIQ